MTIKPSPASGGFGLLDVVVLLAMAVTAIAFATGLVMNSGIDTIASAIAGAALFMVMASSHFVITRSVRTASVSGRLDEIEDALVVLDTDLQRIDQVEDDVARLDLLNDRLERLDNALADAEGGGNLAGAARFERLSGELEGLQERLEALRSDVETASRAQREEIGSELKSLEQLIKAFSHELTDTASVPDAAALPPRELEPQPMSLMRRMEEADISDEAPAPDLDAIEDAEADVFDIEPGQEEDAAEFVVVMTEDVTLELMAEEPAALDADQEEPEELDLALEDFAVAERAVEEPPGFGLASEESAAFDLSVEEPAPFDVSPEEPTPLDLSAEEPAPFDVSPEEPAPFDLSADEPTPFDLPADEEEPAPFDLTVERPAPFERATERSAALDFPEEEPAFDPDLLPVLRQAIEANRIELYLQPIGTLPERTLRYCDAVTRVRTQGGELVGPERYQRIAELAGLLPRIDNMMLVKSVQLLRRLGPDSKLKRVFCTLSAPSLLDHDFFPELVEFLEENSALGESLTFQLSQRAIRDLGEGELASLKTLGKLGFCFSLNKVVHLDLDFGALRDYFFRFVKVGSETFLDGMQKARAPVPAADMVAYLDRFDLKLIVEKVEDEASLDRLVQYGVELAEGEIFGEPKPVSAEMFSELEEAGA